MGNWTYAVVEDLPDIPEGFGHQQGSLDHWANDPRVEDPMVAFLACAIDDALELADFPLLANPSRFDAAVELGKILGMMPAGCTVSVPAATEGWRLVLASSPGPVPAMERPSVMLLPIGDDEPFTTVDVGWCQDPAPALADAAMAAAIQLGRPVAVYPGTWGLLPELWERFVGMLADTLRQAGRADLIGW